MSEYSSGDLMAAVLALQDATAAGLSALESRLTVKVDSKIEGLRHEMNRRFDKVDLRFDEVDRRFAKVDLRFDEVDRRFDRLEGRVGASSLVGSARALTSAGATSLHPTRG